jgi:hypothetical protein
LVDSFRLRSFAHSIINGAGLQVKALDLLVRHLYRILLDGFVIGRFGWCGIMAAL